MLHIFLLWLGCFLFSPDLSESVDASDDVVREFEVPKGASGYAVGGKLEKEGFIVDSGDWKWFLKHEADGSCIKAGRFELTRAMTIPQMAKVLCDKPMGNGVPFTVLEGWRIQEIDAALAEAGYILAGEYATLAAQPALFNLPFEGENLRSLEGFLLPETYRLNPNRFKTKQFIQRQLRTFWERFAREHGSGMEHRGFYEVVIMASLLEREEPDPKLRPMVAGILWKRLENKWHLGVDATSRYSIHKWNDRKAFLKQLRDPKDPYNTRLRPGLPPTPIGNPSIESLEAAMKPESSPYWFYLHDSNGLMHPSRTAKEHEAYRKRYNVY
jgi:UPF0755 protein